MKRAIAAYHEPTIRDYVQRACAGDRDAATELAGYLSGSFGLCCNCGAQDTASHYCETRARVDAMLGKPVREVSAA
jgi:hypothetical protein